VGEIDLVRAAGRPKHVAVLLAALMIGYPLVPQGGLRQIFFAALAVCSFAMGLWGASAVRTAARPGWFILFAGFGIEVLADVMFSLEQYVFHVNFYPVPSDAVYLCAYVVLALGMLRLVRGGSVQRDRAALLDSAIVAVGVAVVVVTFFISPITGDSTLNLAGRAVASAYPAADVLLVAVLVRLCTTASVRSTACRLLLLSLAATFAADIAWNVLVLRDPRTEPPAWMDLLWLIGHLCAGAAACTRSAASLSGRGPEEEPASSSRLVSPLVAVGLVLPGVTLFVDGFTSDQVSWRAISIGSVALSVLVLLRLRLLVRAAAAQAAQLAAIGGEREGPGDPDGSREIELDVRGGPGIPAE
jgi:hypothetical protein